MIEIQTDTKWCTEFQGVSVGMSE